LFASEAVLLAGYDEKKVREKGEYGLLDVFAGAMTHDADYSYYLSYGTNGKQNIVYAFNKANELFNENLK